MARSIPGDDGFPELSHNDDYRSYLISRSNLPGDYRFARTNAKRARVQIRTALRHVNGYFRSIIEAVVDAKIRRLERELTLRGIRYDLPVSNQVASESESRALGPRQ
ncbi:MAG: hypothetical protein HXX15_12840 [Rhodopseudomonas sp.]|uniref:hypothetical protein n=1 Tax=Rhodopseudomonas sp. TaxID=1078 RepID=UPI001859DA70|nr:hypothetical protein [Rhodopseudomonas sp.]NVN86960.1 hypothetical protein [Rhodopseudomonas sp.]